MNKQGLQREFHPSSAPEINQNLEHAFDWVVSTELVWFNAGEWLPPYVKLYTFGKPFA